VVLFKQQKVTLKLSYWKERKGRVAKRINIYGTTWFGLYCFELEWKAMDLPIKPLFHRTNKGSTRSTHLFSWLHDSIPDVTSFPLFQKLRKNELLFQLRLLIRLVFYFIIELLIIGLGQLSSYFTSFYSSALGYLRSWRTAYNSSNAVLWTGFLGLEQMHLLGIRLLLSTWKEVRCFG